MYAVSSNPGCTVINGDMAVDIPAGGQSVILALDKKLIIDGDDNAKFVEVRWGTNAAVGSRPAPSWMGDVVDGLISIVGEGKFDINYIPAENKLYLQFSLEVTTEQIEEVESLLESVLPSNVVSEIDMFPLEYTRVEYLESLGSVWQIINTELKVNYSWRFELTAQYVGRTEQNFQALCGTSNTANTRRMLFWVSGGKLYFTKDGGGDLLRDAEINEKILYSYQNGKVTAGDKTRTIPKIQDDDTLHTFGLFGATRESLRYVWSQTRIWDTRIWDNTGRLVGNFIPVLDLTGTPCMFDTVTRTPFYNAGTGDFTYPGKETEATTYSLRNRMYAQYTEHGIRRLYHVPEGYNGSKEEYASEHGFKLLVETPQPEEGYWTPVWHDREDCIELEWVETEPPTEEELQIEEIENA